MTCFLSREKIFTGIKIEKCHYGYVMTCLEPIGLWLLMVSQFVKLVEENVANLSVLIQDQIFCFQDTTLVALYEVCKFGHMLL